jgi:hypothetical protein
MTVSMAVSYWVGLGKKRVPVIKNEKKLASNLLIL